MPDFDATAKAHLDSKAPTKPIFFMFFDVDGDPLRVTTVGHAVTLPVHADPDLSEKTFYPSAHVVTVGEIRNDINGNSSVPVELSGLLLPDADLLDAIGDRATWQTRDARIWVLLRDQARTQQGAIASFFTGYMSSVRIIPKSDKQTIRLDLDSYRALLTSPSQRSYLDQKRYDAADNSALATIGAANQRRTGPGALIGIGNIGGGGGGRIENNVRNL